MSRKYRDWLEKEASDPVYHPPNRDPDGYPLQGVDIAGPPPPIFERGLKEALAGPPPRFERGIERGLKEALVERGLETRLKESLKTVVPRLVTEYEKWLIEEIQRLKKKDTVV